MIHLDCAPEKWRNCHWFHLSDSDSTAFTNGSSAGLASCPDQRFLPSNRQRIFIDYYIYCSKKNWHQSVWEMAAWNCGSLTAICWDLCEETGYDILALTEILLQCHSMVPLLVPWSFFTMQAHVFSVYVSLSCHSTPATGTGTDMTELQLWAYVQLSWVYIHVYDRYSFKRWERVYLWSAPLVWHLLWGVA